MKKQRFSARMVLSSIVLAGFAVPMLISTGAAAPRPITKLEIWPGQRVVMILPVKTGADFQGGPELATAISPIIQQALQASLARTGKFSVVAPYRFDPILRRGVVEGTILDADVTTLLSTPGLESAQNVLGKIKFDQPAMILESKIEELVVGGTAKAPTVQLQVSGTLYEVGNVNATAPKNVTVRSNFFAGQTPEIRLQAAATQAFDQLAARFIEPPASFQLPAPALATPTPATVVVPTPATPVTLPPVPIVTPPANVTVTPPTALSPVQGQSFIPQLPPAQPPLNIAVGESAAGVR